MSIFFELETPTKASKEETMLLYALGEELEIKDKFVGHFNRLSADKIRIRVDGISDATRAHAHVYNQLRLSKNYMAHICAVTII